MKFRKERDPLGELEVPADAYYGVQTMRAVNNFRISGLRAPADLVTATILIKKAAAEANAALGRLDPEVARAIIAAADEILAGRLRDEFVVDVYQAGAGTSHNMNANEVLANRAAEILGEPRGTYRKVHPNDHVNMGQSTNDVFPTATRLALLLGAGPLAAAARTLAESLARKAHEFAARHQDRPDAPAGRRADHVRPGVQRLRGVYRARRGGRRRGGRAAARTEHRRHRRRHRPECRRRIPPPRRELLSRATRTCRSRRRTISFASRRAWATSSRTPARCAGWRSSSARSRATSGCSAWARAPVSSEITLPAVQPGSSIMPGKVNPSVPEMVNQVCFQVIGCDTTIAMAAEAGQLELNVMMPVIAWNALHASTILREAIRTLTTLTVDGLTANPDRARELLERSTATATALSPYIGYAATAEIAKESVKTGKTIRELVLARGLLDAKQLDAILSVEAMTRGGITGAGEAGGQERLDGHDARRACGRLRGCRWLCPATSRQLLPRRAAPSVGDQRVLHLLLLRNLLLSLHRRISGCSKRRTASNGRSPIRSWIAADRGRVDRRRPRRGRRMVHGAAVSARRTQRARVRRRHPAGDD